LDPVLPACKRDYKVGGQDVVIVFDLLLNI